MYLPDHIKAVLESAECLYSQAQVEFALDQMANAIHHGLANTNPIFLCTLIGGIVPMGNLLPRLDFPLEVDYIHATRYQGNTRGGQLSWRASPKKSLENRVVVLVDDILDTGVTLHALVEYCRSQGAARVYTAVLVDKSGARLPEGLQSADFVGLEVGNRYVFGYGLDYKEYLRNARGIFAVAPEYEA